MKKSEYQGAIFIRVDEKTAKELRDVMKITERNQSDAIRWSVRQIAKILKGENIKINELNDTERICLVEIDPHSAHS